MSELPPVKKRGLYGQMLAGSLWALALRWGLHAMGFVSVVMLARLLTPADFGIVAMGTLLAAFIGSFTEMGTGMLLIRMREITRADCDTAWTFQLLQGALIGALLLVLGPFAVQYFAEPRLLPVIHVYAAMVVVGATANIGTTLVRKALDFARDFRFGLYRKLATILSTLALAVLWRDYWALVIGQVLGTMAGVLLSYRMHPYRPRLSLERARQFLTFSVAIVFANIAKLLKSKVDVIVIGGYGNAALTGTYNVASELATMGTREVVTPIWRGLFPTFATIAHDRDRLRAAYSHFLGTVAVMCLPLGVGLCLVAGDCVPLIFGDQWLAAVPVLRWLAISAMLLALIDVMSSGILYVSGHERRGALVLWVHLAVLTPAVMVASKIGGVEVVAMAATLTSAVMLPFAAFMLIRSLDFGPKMIWRALWRPVAAVCAMAALLVMLPVPAAWPAIARLASRITLGAAVYAGCLAMLWAMAGRPEGPEHAVWRILRGALARRSS